MIHIVKFLFLFLFLFPAITVSAKQPNKFQLWENNGFFRGFNAGYWSSHDDYVKTVKDIRDIKKAGANLIKINIYGGTVNWKKPYKTKKESTLWLDTMIKMARTADLYYVIDVRAGPGRKDVSEEHKHTIWKNKREQEIYAHMLKGYVKKYGQDPFFVGLNLMVEPNPLWAEIENDKIETPLALKQGLIKRGIDIHAMFEYFISQIRSVNNTLPVIVQNIQYSDPQWWELMKKYDDPYIVYDVHSYAPFDFSHAQSKYSKKYPGVYWSSGANKDLLYNKKILNQVIFKHPQHGGKQYLSDIVDIAKKEGWHFCLWSFRSDNPTNKRYINFDLEKWGNGYWSEALTWFKT